MICPKCGAENKNESKFCKICGAALAEKPEEKAAVSVPAAEAEVQTANEPAEKKTEAAAPKLKFTEEEDLRGKTSPLAVRMQEKFDRADKKVQKKLKRGRVWASIAIIMTVLFLLENAAIVSYELGYLDDYISIPEKKTEEEVPPPEPIAEPEPEKTGAARYAGEWSYSYKLEKYHDADLSGNYATKTEEIVSSGKAVFTDIGNNHMAVMIIPSEMTVDGASAEIGATPEAFSGWFDGTNIGIQMKGTEQKFFAPGGNEPITIEMPVSEENGINASFSKTYDKTVGEMNMRYVFTVNFTKNQ